MGKKRALIAVVALMLLIVSIVTPASRADPSSLVARDRYGFVVTSSDWYEEFDITQLRAGWYVDATQPFCGLSPEGMERAFLLRIYTGYTVDPGWLGSRVDNHPGNLWLIGNEPDRRGVQDDVEPEEYARIYHDLYAFIKGRDPTSQISPGGVVQPTPLRLEWLDRVLAAYQAQYGQQMPVDVWNIHNAILNEVSCDYDPNNCWGAGVPPGIDAPYGEIRTVNDNDNMTMFMDQIWAFRQWMADNGYGGHPLIVSEYGVLMPDDYGFDAARVNAFMSNTFDFFTNTTDQTLGDPNDGYRLVQRWAWFSLDVQPWDPVSGEGFNGNLFNPDTKVITTHGLHFSSHTSSFPALNYVDLSPNALWAPPVSNLADSAQTVTRTVQVEILNEGTVDSGSFTVTLEYDGPLNGMLEQAVANVPAALSQWATFSLANLQPGKYDLSVWIDPYNEVDESTICNNQATGTIVAPTDSLYLPLVSRQGAHAISSTDAIGHRQGVGAATAYTTWSVTVPALDFQEFEVPTADSYPAQMVMDAGGGVWIGERDGNKIARFDPQSQTEPWEEYEIETPDSQPWGLALDGAGGVWFAETAANRIGRLDIASGSITEYDVPTANSEPWEVAVGSGGIVWFTEKAGNKIGKLVPATGIITEYSVPTPNAGPSGITIYGIHAWFTESAADRLGRLRLTTGEFEELQRPAGGWPQDIVVTGGGNLWFTEMEANQIVLYDPQTSGKWLEIDASTTDSEPYGIAMEGNVAVWFTERAGNKLGRFTGPIPPYEYSLPTPNSLPTDIVVDGTGCAWYTAPGSNRIGRLCPPLNYFVHLPLITRDYTPGLSR